MIFNTQIPIQREKAIERFNYLINKKKRIAIVDKKPKRSIAQNSYLHLILSWFGLHFGYTLEEVKQEIFKKHVNPDIFYLGDKEGIVTIDQWKSTADCDSGELTTAIERFRNFSAEFDLYLAEPSDLATLQHYENELSTHQAKVHL